MEPSQFSRRGALLGTTRLLAAAGAVAADARRAVHPASRHAAQTRGRYRLSGCAVEMAGDLVHDIGGGTRLHVRRAARDVRYQEHAGQPAQRMRGGQQLFLARVEAGEDVAAPKPREQRIGRRPA